MREPFALVRRSSNGNYLIYIEEHLLVLANRLDNYGLAAAMAADAILIVSADVPPCLACGRSR